MGISIHQCRVLHLVPDRPPGIVLDLVPESEDVLHAWSLLYLIFRVVTLGAILFNPEAHTTPHIISMGALFMPLASS